MLSDGGIRPTAESGLYEIQTAFLIEYYFCISEQETFSFWIKMEIFLNFFMHAFIFSG